MIRIFPILLVLAVIISGCSAFKTQPEYVQAETVPALKLPDGMDRPDTAEAYQVPPGPRGALSEEEIRPPQVLASSRAVAQGFVGQVLQVHDEPDSVWHRLGFAIPRIGLTILSRDEGQRRYQVALPVRQKIERNWLSRILMFWKPDYRETEAVYLIEVRAHERISRIYIGLGNDAATEAQARQLLKQLKLRLG